MKVVIFGGSGFLGQGIVLELKNKNDVFVTIVSRKDAPDNLADNVSWVKSDMMSDENWQSSVDDADWVIDCVGILLPTKVSYKEGIFNPAKRIVNYLETFEFENRPKFMYISAKKVPSIMYGYKNSKQKVEKLIKIVLEEKYKIIYPAVMYDKTRPYSVFLALMINTSL